MTVDARGVDLVRVDFVEVDLVAPNRTFTRGVRAFIRVHTCTYLAAVLSALETSYEAQTGTILLLLW